ncbi:MAG: hypothetical protein ACRD8W_19810 [Nitrososphaeraceae archaeon]
MTFVNRLLGDVALKKDQLELQQQQQPAPIIYRLTLGRLSEQTKTT